MVRLAAALGKGQGQAVERNASQYKVLKIEKQCLCVSGLVYLSVPDKNV